MEIWQKLRFSYYDLLKEKEDDMYCELPSFVKITNFNINHFFARKILLGARKLNFNFLNFFSLIPRPVRDYMGENTLTWQASYWHAVKQPASSNKAAKRTYLLNQGRIWNHLKPHETTWNHLKTHRNYMKPPATSWNQLYYSIFLLKISYSQVAFVLILQLQVIFWEVNLIPKSEVLQINWNLAQGYGAICLLRF